MSIITYCPNKVYIEVTSVSQMLIFSLHMYTYSFESKSSASWICKFQYFFCLGLQPYPFILVE